MRRIAIVQGEHAVAAEPGVVITTLLGSRGAVRQRLRARIFGGANIIAGLGGIGSENAAFARRFMGIEGIPTGPCDLGGTSPRRVEFRPYEGQVRSIRADDTPPTAAFPPLPPCGDIDLF